MRFIFLVVFSFFTITSIAGNTDLDKTKQAKEWISNQPLLFVENRGQFTNSDGKPADNVLFKASYGNCDIYITTKGLSYVFVKYEEKQQKSRDTNDFRIRLGEIKQENKSVSYYRLDMNLQGSAINKAQILKELPGKQGVTNYFYPTCPDGIYDVQEYGKITIKNIYKGIDWVIYTNAENKEAPLKYDFVVQPQANYKDIKIKFVNAQSTSLADNGTKLKIQTIAGNIEEGKLYSYLENSTQKQAIKTSYKANSDSTLEFELGAYDKTKTLVIDPLVWATYYGGSSGFDNLTSICIDSQDFIYIAGHAGSTDFPTQLLNGAYWQPSNESLNICILKFNSHGVRQWATYYGGNSFDRCFSICADSKNNVYLTGSTTSGNFPTQQLAGSYNQLNIAGSYNVFILKFDPNGIRQWATYYGGNYMDFGNSISSDSNDNIYITGTTYSADFPLRRLEGAYNQKNISSYSDIFLLKFNTHGVQQWATYYGGNDEENTPVLIADSQDNIFITGGTYSKDFPTQPLVGSYFKANNTGNQDIFIIKFDKQGFRQWATYYGGSGNECGFSICSDSQSNIYISGETYSINFPTHQLLGAYSQLSNAGGSDLFVLKFLSHGALQWATYYGGNDQDIGYSINSDQQDNLYITGTTQSTNFPLYQVSGEYWQPSKDYVSDAYLLLFNNQGTRIWSTYYGGGDWDMGTASAFDSRNSFYSIGHIGLNSYTIDYGNGAHFDNMNGSKGYILKVEHCLVQKPTLAETDRNNICINDNGSITLTSTGGVGDTLKWYSDNLGLNFIGKGTPLIISSPPQTTTYYARWESLCDTSECDSVNVVVIPSMSLNKYASVCSGETYTVGISNYTIAGIYTDMLKSISGCDSSITTNLLVNPTKQTSLTSSICQGESFAVGTNNYSTSGNYIDVLKTSLGCDSTVTTILTVNPVPEVSLGNDQLLCPGDTITLSVSTLFISYLWSDGSLLSDLIVTGPGNYSVTAYNEWCPASDEVTINECGAELWLPNAFSPDDDGVNERFKPVILGTLNSYQIIIYNRWGQELYESNDASTGWDGTFKGSECSTGQYVYMVTYSIGTEPGTQKQLVQRGSITLLR